MKALIPTLTCGNQCYYKMSSKENMSSGTHRTIFSLSLREALLFLVVFPHAIFAQPEFEDVTSEAGINHYFKVFGGIFGGGAAVLDFNVDGYEDVFITGGNGNNHLYKNNGDGTFKNVSSQSGMDVLNSVITQGAVSADVNKDGFPDLYITTIALADSEMIKLSSDKLLINNGDGTFTDKSQQYGITKETFSTAAAFGDVNRDGYPDLYVSTYFKNYEGRLDQYGGAMLNNTKGPDRDLLYINDGTKLIESSALYGMDHIGLGFQGVWSDIDNDRDLDLLIANDFGNRGHPNYLYRNNYPDNSLTEIGKEKNFDYGINGMGIGVGDYNFDGWMDYLVTNIQISPFFVNQGSDKPFLEQTRELGTAFTLVHTNSGSGAVPVSWGANFFDADHDMDLDLFIVNGCLNPPLVPNPNLFLENVDGVFVETAKSLNINDHSIGRGSVVFDYDNDGDLDLLVVNQKPYREEDISVEFLSTRLYRNKNRKNNWLKVKLRGRYSETAGIGSRVEVYVGNKMLVREVDGGSSNESQNSTLAHFGLGSFITVDSIVVKWSRYGTETIYNVRANQTITLLENPSFKEHLSNFFVSTMRAIQSPRVWWLITVLPIAILTYRRFARSHAMHKTKIDSVQR
jgi:enediyne biosynthesis protein E4